MIIIAGPCQLESKEHAEMIALKMKSICDSNGFKYVFMKIYKVFIRNYIVFIRF